MTSASKSPVTRATGHLCGGLEVIATIDGGGYVSLRLKGSKRTPVSISPATLYDQLTGIAPAPAAKPASSSWQAVRDLICISAGKGKEHLQAIAIALVAVNAAEAREKFLNEPPTTDPEP